MIGDNLTIKDFLPRFSLVLILIYFFFGQVLAVFVNYTELLLWVACLLQLMYFVGTIKITISFSKDKLAYIPLLILLIMYISNNKITQTNLNPFSVMVTFLLATSYMFSFSGSNSSISFAKKAILYFSMFHIIITIVFLIVPQLSDWIMVPIWLKGLGEYPTGADGGLYNYRVGFTLHYSSNAMFCTCGVLVLFSYVINKYNHVDKLKYILLFVMSLFALLLTAKRGHLVFSLITCSIIYILKNGKNGLPNLLKYIFIVGIALLALFVLSGLIPSLSNSLSRFTGSDDLTTGRITYWEVCIEYFKKNPIFGIGWYGFRNLYQTLIYNSNSTIYTYLDAHNVYLQLLCETGIVGLLCYSSLYIYILILTIIKCLKAEGEDKIDLCLSLCIQVFVMLYSITGNCLYDHFYYIYIIGVGIVLYYKKNGSSQNYEKNRYINFS